MNELDELGLNFIVTKIRHFARIEALETAFLNFVESTSGQEEAFRLLNTLKDTYRKSLLDSYSKIEHPGLQKDVWEAIESELNS